MKSLLIVLCLFIFLFAGSSLIWANGLTTTTTTNQGQVQVRNEDGVMYLTTETNDGAVVTRVIQENGETVTVSATNSSSFSDIVLPQGFAPNVGVWLNGILRVVMIVAALLVFAYLILGALKWITSGGDKGKTEQARNQITAAVVGLIILASSYAILNLTLRFLGFSDLNQLLQMPVTIYGRPDTQNDARVYETDLQVVIESTPSATPSSN